MLRRQRLCPTQFLGVALGFPTKLRGVGRKKRGEKNGRAAPDAIQYTVFESDFQGKKEKRDLFGVFTAAKCLRRGKATFYSTSRLERAPEPRKQEAAERQNVRKRFDL